jgi:hypothetical protein
MSEWIPVVIKPVRMSGKGQYWWEYEFDCPIPDDAQRVLVTTRYGDVEIDTFINDGPEGCFFENYSDEGDAIAWMPLPEPYKEGDNE